MIHAAPGITRLLDKLETAGLARRERTSPDRRQVFCYITERGLEMLETLDEEMRQADEIAVGNLTDEEQRQLVEAARRRARGTSRRCGADRRRANGTRASHHASRLTSRSGAFRSRRDRGAADASGRRAAPPRSSGESARDRLVRIARSESSSDEHQIVARLARRRESAARDRTDSVAPRDSSRTSPDATACRTRAPTLPDSDRRPATSPRVVSASDRLHRAVGRGVTSRQPNARAIGSFRG